MVFPNGFLSSSISTKFTRCKTAIEDRRWSNFFKLNNPPYWNAGDVFGYLVLAGHGTITNDCSNTTAVNGLLTAALGPIGAAAPELPVEWLRTNTLCPSPGTTYDSLKGTNSDGPSIDVVNFTIPGQGTIFARNFSHGNLTSPITPPAPNSLFVMGRTKTNIVLHWLGEFQLQSAPSLPGTFTDVTGALNGPYTNTLNGQQRYFRLRQ